MFEEVVHNIVVDDPFHDFAASAGKGDRSIVVGITGLWKLGWPVYGALHLESVNVWHKPKAALFRRMLGKPSDPEDSATVSYGSASSHSALPFLILCSRLSPTISVGRCWAQSMHILPQNVQIKKPTSKRTSYKSAVSVSSQPSIDLIKDWTPYQFQSI